LTLFAGDVARHFDVQLNLIFDLPRILVKHGQTALQNQQGGGNGVGRLHDTPEWVGICTPEDLDVLNRLEMAFSLSADELIFSVSLGPRDRWEGDFRIILRWHKPNCERRPMDEISGTNLTGNENDTLTCRQKPKDGRARTSAVNGKCGGRPRGAGVKLVDWGKYQRLGFEGLPMETIARQLGVSVRTFKRRRAELQRQDSPM
jgi:hypothetical protein